MEDTLNDYYFHAYAKWGRLDRQRGRNRVLDVPEAAREAYVTGWNA